jgi:hypothetical protein
MSYISQIPDKNTIELQLGDIILIKDPTSDIINDEVFLIDYIDNMKLKLINEKTLKPVQLKIQDGVLNNGTITEIELLSRNPEVGYARQNQLLPGEWINLFFGGDIPLSISGEITNLEEDMIEIKTYPDGDIIYINFAYKGIPEELPIDSFELRSAPTYASSSSSSSSSVKEPSVNRDITEEDDLDLGELENLEDFPDTKQLKQNIRQLIVEADQIEFGDYVGAIQEYVDIDKDKYRYNVDVQTNDLLDELLSNIPNHQRTHALLNNIHIMITRFLQLREMGSIFDKNKNIVSILKKTANYKPLVEYLKNFKNKLYWILFVAKNIKKVYNSLEKEENPDSLDVSFFSTMDSIKNMNEKFHKYKTNNGSETQNRYVELYSSLNPEMTPFFSIDPEKNNEIIFEKEVEDDMNVIINNLNDLYSSVSKSANIVSRRFVIQKYNLGLNRLESTNMKGGHMHAHKVKLTNNDLLSLQSVLTLPEPTVRFSQINLPGSSLMTKTNLNLHFLNYWQLLKKNTSVSTISINSLETEMDYNEDNFIDNIKNFVLDLVEPVDVNTNNKEKLDKFLDIIIPRTRVLFNSIKKYIRGKLSMETLISYLEPFHIYSNDITYMQYVEINKFIKSQIIEYNKKFVENGRKFSAIKNMQFNQPIQNNLFEMLNKNMEIKQTAVEKYGGESNLIYNNSELLKKITLMDFGNLYNTSVAFENIALMFPNELNAIFDSDKDKLHQALLKDTENNKCKAYIISKKYSKKENLLEDNGRIIFFDKIYDTTPYNLLDDFLKEQSQLSTEEFILFLSEKLQKKYKYSAFDAEYTSETLINGFKKVMDNHYAVLLDENKVGSVESYYVRKNNEWIEEKNIDPEVFMDDPDSLCLVQPNCLPSEGEVDEKCDSLDMNKDTIVGNALKQIMTQFDKNYQISKEELLNQLNQYLARYTQLFDKLEDIEKYNFYKYNNQQYQEGLKEIHESTAIQSPFNQLRDLILGQVDFVKKQNDILLFTNKFTRKYQEDVPNIADGELESPYWLYCKQSNTKLLPTFFYELASVYIQNNKNYDMTMNNIIKNQGVLSEDGGNWEDKYSGYAIKPIDWDVEEGYKDGFRVVSRGILEDELGQTLTTALATKKVKQLNPQSQAIMNIVESLSTFMGLSIPNQHEFIIQVVTNLMGDSSILVKEETYKRHQEEMIKKGKNLPEYQKIYNSTFLYLTLGMYLIAIQTSIPSIRVRKTFPGCIRAFSGFPTDGEGDYLGLTYLACVTHKIKSDISPWNILRGASETDIADNIKTFTLKYMLPTIDVSQKIKEKAEYILVYPEETIPEDHDISKWTNFLPPLQKIEIKNLQNISDGFADLLKKDIRSGLPKQLERILVIESKIIQFSFAIQEAIGKIVEKKKLLLKSSVHPYMDNACCNEQSDSITALQYFIKDNHEIAHYNSVVEKLSSMITDIHLLTEASIFLSTVNTKRSYPALSQNFGEETIYSGFIHYCKFNSLVPVPNDLLILCKEKPEYINSKDSMQEKIRKLKRDGRNYTEDSFLRLLQIVSRNNIIHVHSSSNEYTSIQRMRDLFETFDKTNDDTIASSFRGFMENIMDTYDISVKEDTIEMRNLKNYLDKSNSKMKTQLLRFINNKGKLRRSEYRNIEKFINNLTMWKFDGANSKTKSGKIADDAMYNYIQFFKTYISMFVKVYPNMILNQQNHSIDVPDYWRLSIRHSKDIKSIVDTFYETIKKFYGNNVISPLLNDVQKRCYNVLLLSLETPALTNIVYDNETIYSVFDKRTSTLLYEYYLLQVLTTYIELTDNPQMIHREVPDFEDELFATGEPITTEIEFLKGDTNKLKENIANLLITFLQTMMEDKSIIDVSYDQIMDRVFNLKEKEKDTFTDRLKELTDEERNIDTILKINKLGVWNKGMLKGLKEYDPENYDQERDIMTKIAEIEKKVTGDLGEDDGNLDIYMYERLEEMQAEEEIDRENYDMSSMNDDYLDGDYYGDEQENNNEYD